jgi:lipopolysaccharide export system permease protein
MTKVTRYVTGELLKVFLVTLAGMTLLMLIVGLVQEALRQGLGPEPILKLVPYAMPNALRFAVPGTILFAVCSVYGRMSASNEITAMKALGISPMTSVVPALVLAFLVSLVAVWLNDLAVSWGRKGMQRVVMHSVEQIAYGMLRTQRSYTTRQFSINVKRVDDRTLIRPMIYLHSQDHSPPVVLNAEQAELQLDQDDGVLNVLLTDGEVSVGDEVTLRFPNKTMRHEIPLTEAARKGNIAGAPSSLPLWQVAPETREQRTEIEQLQQQFAIEAAYQMLTGVMTGLKSADWLSRQKQLAGARDRLHRLQTAPWRRWANGFSCLFFVMVGAPLGIRMRNADLWTTFAVCFLPILIVYYPLLAYGVDRAKCGELPPYSVWLGNVILAAAGLWLLRKVVRY